MSKTKYKYNPKTLTYDEVSVSWRMRIFKFGLYLAPSVLFGMLFSFLFTKQLISPKEKDLKAEVEFYKSEYEKQLSDLDLIYKDLEDIQRRDEDLYRTSLYAEKLPKDLHYRSIGDHYKYNYLEGYSNSELLVKSAFRIDAIERRLNEQTNSFKNLLEIAKNKEQMLASIPAIQPVHNKELKQMASGYGYRIDPIYKTRKMHTGMDFTAEIGTEVYVTADGIVESVEIEAWGYGKSIVVNHGYGYKTRYAHLNNFNVRKGQKIKRGELIGFVGNTGKSTGPHLHYEVLKGGNPVNPIHYYHSDLTPEQYEKLIEMSQNSFKAFD
ncbi:MAG: M23 family metallopeptidase [Flavobacteriia bacterium]|nr:M23 family metallopeptidase [Flavobacteriia bacterium]